MFLILTLDVFVVCLQDLYRSTENCIPQPYSFTTCSLISTRLLLDLTKLQNSAMEKDIF